MSYNNYFLGDRDLLIKPKNYTLITPAISAAVELEEIKERLREVQGVNYFDNELLSLIKSATQYGELITGRDFINKSYRCYLGCFPVDKYGIQIRKSKLQSITSIKYYKDGSLVTFDSSNYYITDESNYSSIFTNKDTAWPKDADQRAQAIQIEFVAGYGDDSCDLPPLLKEALISHIISLFKNKGDCSLTEAHKQYKQLYNPFINPQLIMSAA